MATTNNNIPSPSAIMIDTPEGIALFRLIVLKRGVEFEAKMKAKGIPMLITRVGGGAIRTAKRELGLPRNTKPEVIIALLDRAIEEAQGR
jgi:hypothetical protein